MVEPIEIKAVDLIPRPDTLGGASEGVGSPGLNLADVQKLIQGLPGHIKEFQQTLETINQLTGGRLERMIPLLRGKGNQGDADPPGAANRGAGAGGQFILMIHLLQAKYGNVTVRELLEKATAEYGDTRLADILKVKL